MIRVVLDANLLVSGVNATRGTLKVLFDLWADSRFAVVTSDEILAEVQRAWSKPYWQRRLPPDSAAQALEYLLGKMIVVTITDSVEGVASHPEDDVILATAVSGKCQYLVTGDRQLVALKAFQGVQILTPEAFVRRIEITSIS